MEYLAVQPSLQPGLEAVYPRCHSPEPPSYRSIRGSDLNIERAVSPTAGPTPCALRDNLVEDCSHAKLVNWIWSKRATAFHLEAWQRNECPMPLCREIFNEFDDMIAHLQSCAEVARGWYWCWDCYRAEEFPLAHCRSCKCTWTQSSSLLSNTVKKVKKVKRAVSNSLRRSLKGKKPRKESDVPLQMPTSPVRPASELLGRPVPELQPSAPSYDPHHPQSFQAPFDVSTDPWANFASIASVSSRPSRTVPATELPAGLTDCPTAYSAPPTERSTPSSSMSGVSLLSFRSSSRPMRGSLVSLATPRSSVSGSRIVSPLSPLSAATNAAEAPSRLTEEVFCESPTQMDEGENPNSFASWTQPNSASRSSTSTSTCVSQAGQVSRPSLQLPELEGSIPDLTQSLFAKEAERLGRNSFRLEFLPQGFGPQPTESYLAQPAAFTPEQVHETGRKSTLLEELKILVSTRLNNAHLHLGVGPLLNSLRSMSVYDIMQAGISEIERQLTCWSGDPMDKLCFAYLARAMAERDLPRDFCAQLDRDMEQFVWSGDDALSLRFMAACRYFLDGLQVHLPADLGQLFKPPCPGCSFFSPLPPQEFLTTGLAAFPGVNFRSIDGLLDGMGSAALDVELGLISAPRIDNLSPFDPRVFFQEYPPAMPHISDQLYCTCHDRTEYHRRAAAFMRQYYVEQSGEETVVAESRQNSWSSSSSTAADWDGSQPLPSPAQPPAARPPAGSISSQQTRRARSAVPQRRLRPARQENKRGPCQHCGYTATGNDSLKLWKRHMKTHEEMEEMFECGFPTGDGSVCTKAYNRADNLRGHQKRDMHVHGGHKKKLLRKRMPGGPKYKPDIS